MKYMYRRLTEDREKLRTDRKTCMKHTEIRQKHAPKIERKQTKSEIFKKIEQEQTREVRKQNKDITITKSRQNTDRNPTRLAAD